MSGDRRVKALPKPKAAGGRAQVIASKHGAVIARDYGRIYVWGGKRASVLFMGKPVPIAELPSMNIPFIDRLMQGKNYGTFTSGNTKKKQSICSDCDLVFLYTKLVRKLAAMWNGKLDPWQVSPDYVAYAPSPPPSGLSAPINTRKAQECYISGCVPPPCPPGMYWSDYGGGCQFSYSYPSYVSGPEPAVYVYNDVTGQYVDGQTQTIGVGQQVKLSAAGSDGSSPSCNWTIPAGGAAVGNYSPAQGLAVKTPVTTSGTNSVAFYWTAAATGQQISVSCTVMGTSVSSNTTYTVQAPTPVVSVPVHRTSLSVDQTETRLAPDWSIHDGNPVAGQVAIQWNYSVTNVPQGGTGNIVMQQIVNTLRNTGTNTNNQAVVAASYTNCADGGFPYDTPATTGSTFTSDDSPAQDLTGYHTMSIDYAFTDYFMYQPSGGIWVTLGTLTWGASGSTSWTGTTWTAATSVSTPLSAFSRSSSLPIWACYVPSA